MKQGLTLTELAVEVERRSKLKADYVVDTREITMLNGAELSLPVDGSASEFGLTRVAHRQLGARLGIPATFYDRLREPDTALDDESREQLRRLLDTNVNTLFRQAPERRMVRTWGGEQPMARAFLSDKYRRRDDAELAEAVLPILGEIPDVQFVSTGLTDTNLYIKAVAPKVQGEVKAGDVVQAGVVIKNSEVGHGSLSIGTFVYRLWCSNGCGTDEITRHYHVGRVVDVDEDQRVFSDATLKKDDEAFFAKVADSVRSAVDEAKFEDILIRLREAATGERVAKPVESIERLSQRFTLTDDEGQSVLKHLIEGADLTAYGMLNAVTRASQDVDSYERATELESVGGKILAMAGTSEWTELAAA